MGSQASKGEAPSLSKLAQKFPGSLPELFRLISCDITPEDEATAEITSWPSNRDRRFGPGNGFEPSLVEKRRPQQGNPTGMKQPPTPNACAEGAPAQMPLRDRNAPERAQRQAPLGGSEREREKEAPQKSGRPAFRVGDLVELWSKSQQAWCRGSIDKIEGKWVHIAYADPEGRPMTKIMPHDHEEVRPWSASQGNENVPVQTAATSPGQSPWDPAFKPPSAPPRPDGMSPKQPQQPTPQPHTLVNTEYPTGSPPPPLLPEVPPEQCGHEQGAAPAAPWEASGGLFDLPGLSVPDFLKTGNDQPGFVGGLGSPGLFGPLGSLQTPPGAALTSPQSLSVPQGNGSLSIPRQGNQGQTQNGSLSLSMPQGLQAGLGHSQSQPQSLALSPGALGSTPPRKPRPPYVEPDVRNVVPLIPGVERIEPEVVQQLVQSNACVLVDLRGDDRSAGLIPGALHVQAIDVVPFMQKIPGLLQRFQNQSLVIFTCQYSCHRAPQCANWYREQNDPRQRVAIMTGGFRKWDGIGLPTEALGSAETNTAADAYALQQGAQFALAAAGLPGAGVGSHTVAGGQAAGFLPPPPRLF